MIRLDRNTKLLWPFRQLKATVIRSYDCKDRYQVSVREDESVIVVGKEGYKDGFWKIRTGTSEVCNIFFTNKWIMKSILDILTKILITISR